MLLIIDVDGGKQIRALDPNALLIFLKPPSRNALRERIAKRGTETDAEVTKRMERVEKEMEEGEKYHVKVVNDDLDACIKDCLAAIQAHREKLAS
ncbi:MAG: hypothetical protein KDB07_02295 [Planctomycetes bacterium]|nr:hypothetical protein [Planctomycetota bacterium]